MSRTRRTAFQLRLWVARARFVLLIPPLVAAQLTTALRSGDFGSPVFVCSHSLRGRGDGGEEHAFSCAAEPLWRRERYSSAVISL
jgi:hypothetical protein